MLRFGLPLMAAGVVGLVAQLLVRVVINRELGTEALGLFQSSFAISSIYLAFLFGALWMDFYPRAVTLLGDPDGLNELTNNQTQISLFLAGPLFVVLAATAPLVLHLLYSAQFTAADGILRWQVLGEFVRLLASPLAYVLLAAGRSRLVLLVEALTASTFVILTILLLPVFGLRGTGFAYLGSAIVYAVTAFTLSRWRHGLYWSGRTAGCAALALAGTLATVLAGDQSLIFGLAVGSVSCGLLVFLAVHNLGYLLPPAIRDLPMIRMLMRKSVGQG